jgi:hypothetical protein
MTHTPIALFVYNRPDHARQTVAALRSNSLADASDLVIFSDAAKTSEDVEKVAEVRWFLRQIDGFRSVEIVERESNLGLAKSVIDGVSAVIARNDQVIVIEDDIVTAPDFLTFMNQALDRYRDDNSIGTVTGFSLPIAVPRHYSLPVYLTHRHSSWGWGTYGRVWNSVDWEVGDYVAFRNSRSARQAFNVAGPDMARMLDLQMDAKINSWSIRFDYSCFKRKLFSIAPVRGLVTNIGFDGTGTHCQPDSSALQGEIPPPAGSFHFPETLEFDPDIVRTTQKLFETALYRRAINLARRSLRSFWHSG